MKEQPPVVSQNYTVFQTMVIVILVVQSFILGSLWTKVQFLEKGTGFAPTQAANVPSQPQAAPAAGDFRKITKDDHVKGDRNARISLLEYSDYECPFCKRVHPTIQQVMDAYKGKVNWVYRHYPLSFHANAQKEAEASECAYELGGNDAFWKYSDLVYERTNSNGTGFALDALVPLAKEIGLSDSKFTSCLDSGKYTKKVNDDLADGTKAGVTGTPGSIILDNKTGKKLLISGAVPIDQFKATIDEMLK